LDDIKVEDESFPLLNDFLSWRDFMQRPDNSGFGEGSEIVATMES
jgi:hypothetical protein